MYTPYYIGRARPEQFVIRTCMSFAEKLLAVTEIWGDLLL